MTNLIIIGAGGYGYVAREIAESTGKYEKIDFLDDNNPEAIGKFDDFEKVQSEYKCAFVALGNPALRCEWVNKLKKAGYYIEKIISPQSFVSAGAEVLEGSVIEPMAVVHNAAKIGVGVIVCAGAVVNHNSTVRNFCQIDCGAVIAAGAEVKENTKVEYNQVIYKK